jgi:MOSC domain-containing protein YiiM
MKLISVNVGRPRLVLFAGQTFNTAINKSPVEGRVFVGALNVEGDKQANLEVHGGEHKAVYAYPSEHYPIWQKELGRGDLGAGAFGENFSVQGMLEDDVYIGDRYRIGGILVEVTQPRVPCKNLAVKFQSPAIVRQFLDSQRSGFYLRVLEEGEVGAGDPIVREVRDSKSLSVKAIHTLLFFDRENTEGIRAATQIPALSEEWRGQLARYL